MAFCPADCTDVTLLANPDNNCNISLRTRNIDRIMFFTCDTDLPSPFTCGALTTLVTAGKIAFTSPLANVDMQDPNFVQLEIADCLPVSEIASSRIMSFQDRVALDEAAGIVSAGAPAVPFYNYNFWNDKLSNQESLRYAFVYCDGTVEVAKDANGNYLTATLRAFKKQEKIGSGNDAYWIEYIQAQVAFKGDPLNLNVKAELNTDETVFDISTCGFY